MAVHLLLMLAVLSRGLSAAAHDRDGQQCHSISLDFFKDFSAKQRAQIATDFNSVSQKRYFFVYISGSCFISCDGTLNTCPPFFGRCTKLRKWVNTKAGLASNFRIDSVFYICSKDGRQAIDQFKAINAEVDSKRTYYELVVDGDLAAVQLLRRMDKALPSEF